jgi:hypothetical protein
MLLGAILTPSVCTGTAALRVMTWGMEHRFTNDHRVLNPAIWSMHHASCILLGFLVNFLMPAQVPCKGQVKTDAQLSGLR